MPERQPCHKPACVNEVQIRRGWGVGLCIAAGTGNPCCPGERINERPEKDQTVAAIPTGVTQVSASLSMRESMPSKWMAMSWDREICRATRGSRRV